MGDHCQKAQALIRTWNVQCHLQCPRRRQALETELLSIIAMTVPTQRNFYSNRQRRAVDLAQGSRDSGSWKPPWKEETSSQSCHLTSIRRCSAHLRAQPLRRQNSGSLSALIPCFWGVDAGLQGRAETLLWDTAYCSTEQTHAGRKPLLSAFIDHTYITHSHTRNNHQLDLKIIPQRVECWDTWP